MGAWRHGEYVGSAKPKTSSPCPHAPMVIREICYSDFVLQRLTMSALLALLLLGASVPAFAQTGSATATLTGTVVDPDGGFVPGVSVVAKNQGTGQTYPALTNAKGVFSLPALPPGSYTVTISMTSFKTIEMPDVRVSTA